MLKKIPKIITTIFIVVFLFQLIGLIFILTTPEISQAVETPKLQVHIGENFTAVQTDDKTISVPWIGEYISAVYKYAVGIVGILATIVMMFGGVLWITAGGNQERIGNAKSWITASLTGLVLTLCSYLILNTVNPDLTRFKPIKIDVVQKPPETGCCVCEGENEGILSKDDCDKITCGENKGNWGGKDSVWDDENKECSEPDNGGCCGYKYVAYYTDYARCKWKDSKNKCDPNNTTRFYHKNKICNEISGCHPVDCAGKAEGTSCGGGYCYSGSCISGVGTINQPCGDDEGSTCLNVTMFMCPDGFSHDSVGGGRNCNTSLYCCTPD